MKVLARWRRVLRSHQGSSRIAKAQGSGVLMSCRWPWCWHYPRFAVEFFIFSARSIGIHRFDSYAGVSSVGVQVGPKQSHKECPFGSWRCLRHDGRADRRGIDISNIWPFAGPGPACRLAHKARSLLGRQAFFLHQGGPSFQKLWF
jgi:hypothetical protein